MSKIKTIFSILAAILMILPGIASAVNTSPGTSNIAGSTEVVFDTTPPGEVTDLHSTDATSTSLTWEWINPSDTDFANTLIKVVKTNTGAIVVQDVKVPGIPDTMSSYTATGLEPGTSYTITVQTQDNAPDVAAINLCTKEVNEGNPWGYCTGATTTGDFSYETTGATLRFNANAYDLELPTGTEYALIYYKDTDPAHVQPSTNAVNVLATGISVSDAAGSNSIRFSDSFDIGDDIPAADDVNPRGKIWIVPTSEINPDLTLKWTGYGQGNVMTDYLFEEDLDTTLTPPDSMGGITFTYTP